MTQTISIRASDGTAQGLYFAPPRPTTAGVIVYFDVFGIRPAMVTLGERMAGMGYHVLVPDLYYRTGPYGPWHGTETRAQPELMKHVQSIRDANTLDMCTADTAHFVAALTERGATGAIATSGYCMGGARALRAANANPDRIRAAASFHGGNLATDAPDSPHRHLEQMRARVYVASAGVDASFPPAQSAALAQALRAAEVDHMIENYVGCAHGWVPTDLAVHDPAGAERHWRRLEMLFGETLA